MVPLKIQQVELKRYLGKWHEIMRFPNMFERRCVGDVTAEYSLMPDGMLSVVNRCRKSCGNFEEARGVARVVQSKEVTLRVTFVPGVLRVLPFVWANYSVLAVDENYQVALVGEPSRRYLWLLARTKSVPASQVEKMLQIAQQNGFDTSKLVASDEPLSTEPSELNN